MNFLFLKEKKLFSTIKHNNSKERKPFKIKIKICTKNKNFKIKRNPMQTNTKSHILEAEIK